MQKTYSAFAILLVFILLVRFPLFAKSFHVYKNGEHVSFETRVISEPKSIGKAVTFTANLPNGQKIFTKTAPNFELKYGGKVRLEGAVKIKESQGFSNSRFLSLENINTPIFIDYPKILIEKEDNSFFRATIFLRERIVSLFERFLPASLSGLLLGIVFGIKTYIPDSFNEALKTAGVLHVVAASGMNVSMVGGFLAGFFVKFLKRQYALILCILGIWFYAAFAGFESSILRAAVMGSIAFSAQIIGRQNSGLYGLFIAGFLLLFINPLSLFDIGFQLSFLATLGIMQIGESFFKFPLLGEDLAVTLSAQAFTLPILISNFGSYSVFSVVANVFVLWTVPILMILGGLGALSGLIFEPFGAILLYLCLPFLLYFEKLVTFFGNLPFKIEVQNIPWQASVGYFLLLFAVIIFGKLKST